MTIMTPTEVDALWAAIDDQRVRTADLLGHLNADQWLHPSLCEGWNVRHVAAHLTLQRQRLRDVAAFALQHPDALRGLTLNRAIHDSAVVQSRQLETGEIIERIRAMVGSRRHNAFVTPLETLTDILVHSQDIAIPLHLELTMDPRASEIAATRRWDTRGSWLSTVFRKVPLDGYRLTATDTDWIRGDGPDVTGPMGGILVLLCGRPAALAQLHGDGVDRLRSRAA